MPKPTPLTDEWAKLTSLPSKYEADLLAGRLQKEGIRTRTTKTPGAHDAWLKAYGNLGQFDVYVPSAKKKAARQLLGGLIFPRHPSDGRSLHPVITVVGRGLILAAILALIATLLLQALR